MTTAKSLAGGFPLSAVTGKAEIMDGPAPGGLGGTYAGSPLSCAAALAAIDVVEEEKLAERALRLGDLISKRVQALSEEPAGSCIGDIRHLGAMAAMELVTDRKTRAPDAELTKAVVAEGRHEGIDPALLRRSAATWCASSRRSRRATNSPTRHSTSCGSHCWSCAPDGLSDHAIALHERFVWQPCSGKPGSMGLSYSASNGQLLRENSTCAAY